MIERFQVIGHDDPRPRAERIIFCDGTGGRLFRQETDLELSHWRPNVTPTEYRAGTSTEICFRFLDAPISADWTLAVNNHLDVDGILSVYVLVHDGAALPRRETIVQAAEMGDFWGWGEAPAQRLFQGLTLLMDERRRAGVDAHAIYQQAFERIAGLIDGTDADCRAIDESLEPLRRSVALVEDGGIERTQYGPRFAHYVIGSAVAGGAPERAAYVPEFNERISRKAVLWPHARAKWDSQRVCLVSIESPAGWLHDLWAPGYLWADTQGRWTVPGLTFGDGMQSYEWCSAKLESALGELAVAEPNAGRWVSGAGAHSDSRGIQAVFPVVLRFADGDFRPLPSGLAPRRVAEILSAAF